MITAILRFVAPAIVVVGLLIAVANSAMAVDVAGALAQIPKVPELPALPELPKMPDLPKMPTTEVKVEYYVAVEGKQSGPFKCAKLLEMANLHSLTPESKVWKAGMQSWKRAGNMHDLDDIFESVPPPIIDETLPVVGKSHSFTLPCAAKTEKNWWWPF